MWPSRKMSMAKNKEQINIIGTKSTPDSGKNTSEDLNYNLSHKTEKTKEAAVDQSHNAANAQLNKTKRAGLIKEPKPKRRPASSAKKTPKQIRQSIKLDTVNPTDFLTYTLTHSCESCSHWNQDNGLCSLGYKNDVHRLEANLKCYELNGKMAFCRFLEID
jgi:hypothetical protein